MNNPKVIIADTDLEFVKPLQNRFITQFFNGVDLEVITDVDFFNEYFSVAREADIIIVSDLLFSSDLHRHDIDSIFVVSEDPYEEIQTSELNVNHLYKYTNLKELFNEIIGKNSEKFTGDKSQKKETQIITVYSSHGGVGKTSLALALCESFSRNYKNVLFISACYLQDFQYLLENSSVISSNEVYAKLQSGTSNIYGEIKYVLRKERFTYLPPFKASLVSLGLNYSVFKDIAISAKKTNEYDFIVIDAESTFDKDKAELINVSDFVIVLTDQSNASVFSTNQFVENISDSHSSKYIFVCNKFTNKKDNALNSAEINTNFVCNDYIEEIPYCENMKSKELANNEDIQKIVFSIM